MCPPVSDERTVEAFRPAWRQGLAGWAVTPHTVIQGRRGRLLPPQIWEATRCAAQTLSVGQPERVLRLTTAAYKAGSLLCSVFWAAAPSLRPTPRQAERLPVLPNASPVHGPPRTCRTLQRLGNLMIPSVVIDGCSAERCVV